MSGRSVKINVFLAILSTWNMFTCVGLYLGVFSDKTLYEWSHHRTSTEPVHDEGTITYNGSSCRAVHVNAVLRHGATYPTQDEIRRIENLHSKLIKFSKSSEIKNWAIRFDKEKGSQLTPKGKQEHFTLGNRLQQRFSNLFDGTKEKTVMFEYSSMSKTVESYKAFREGFSANISILKTQYVAHVNDTTTQLSRDCFNYRSRVTENDTNTVQFERYLVTPEFRHLVQSITTRLGIGVPLSSGDVYGLYDLCAYGSSIANDQRWCDVMTDLDRDVLEYGRDLQLYAAVSYGNPMNAEIACTLLEDILSTLDTAMNYSWDYAHLRAHMYNFNYVAGKFQFVTLDTLLPLFTALGLFRDPDPLTAPSRAAMHNRKFRTSQIGSYASNLALALYACEDARDTYVMKMFVNERPVSIPACRDTVCLYSDVREYYRGLVDACNMEEICGSERNSAGVTRLHWLIHMVLLTVNNPIVMIFLFV